MKRKILLLAFIPALLISGCTTTQTPPDPGQTFTFTDESTGIISSVVYQTHRIKQYAYQTRCAGTISVKNTSKKDYSIVILQLSFYDESKTLVATDIFQISNGLIAGGSVTLEADYYNPLDHVTPGKVYTKRPSMSEGRMKVTAM